MSSETLVPQNLKVIQSIDISGFPIEVGILPDGTPFMSGRELARACGISNSTLVGWGERTPQMGDRHRAGKMAELLATYRYGGDRFFVPIPDGTKFGGRANVSAYPYQVCMAFLDYYAFEANKEEARNSLRVLSEKQLPQFIYEAVREQPQPPLKLQPELQRVQAGSPFQTRPLRGGIPIGYFTVDQVLAEEQARSLPTSQFPELYAALLSNIEKAWNRYWTIQQLGAELGDRFPMPQLISHDWARPRQYVYPTAALESFSNWLNRQYLPERFPSYLQRKRSQTPSSQRLLNHLPTAV